MEINQQSQYNQGISRYKLLSANAGVGSIITSNLGYYILVSDVNKWDFISASNKRIRDIRNDVSRPQADWYKEAKREIFNNLGIDLVDDERFIEFLKQDKGLTDLLCLAAIPHLSLNENNNMINLKDNPIIERLKERGVKMSAESFSIPGTHFPKWFRNEGGILKTYAQWREDWRRSGKPLYLFAPPRDPNDPYRYGKPFYAMGKKEQLYKELTQINLLLICENGHLSDVPWERYLRWRTDKGRSGGDGSDLFISGPPCCDKPILKWSESKNRSEGYGSIFLECTNCGLGSGNGPGKQKITLEGINNLKPICQGHKPWEIPMEAGQDALPYDTDCCDRTGQRSKMQIALVTGNNVYFANTFSSVYMPIDLVKGLTEEMVRALKACKNSYESNIDPTKTKEGWAQKKIIPDLLYDLAIPIKEKDREGFLLQLKDLFMNGERSTTLDGTDDLHEEYRKQEYEVFTRYEHKAKDGLIFEDISLPKTLAPYFVRIKKVEELKVTSVQLDFTRVRPNERALGPDGKIMAGQGKNVFSIPGSEVYILPAVENFGEGIFFEFRQDKVQEWLTTYEEVLDQRIAGLLPIDGNFNGNALRQKIRRNKAKFLLVHTFSHLIMRELEFTCGYPTASLKERLYVAPDMAGVLIYTAEGSEGSMGGLIWQAHPDRIQDLFSKALERAVDCSSDPLCWESDGQGVFNLDLAACFSCALVAETACEERNLGLDRRVLIDEGFGFFK